MNYAVAANVGDARTATLIVAGITFTVTQAAAAPPMSGFYVLTPCRLIDSRNPDGPYGGPSLAPTTQRNVVAAGQCGIPSGATSLSVNVVAVAPGAVGFLTLYPGPAANPGPAVSTINFRAGQVIANNAMVGVAADGSINIYNGGSSATEEGRRAPSAPAIGFCTSDVVRLFWSRMGAHVFGLATRMRKMIIIARFAAS